MDYIFFQVTAINGFDSLSHYLRAGLIASAACSRYAIDRRPAASRRSARPRSRAPLAAARERSDPRRTSRDSRPPAEPDSRGRRRLARRTTIERITRIEDPEIAKQREERLERIRDGREPRRRAARTSDDAAVPRLPAGERRMSRRRGAASMLGEPGARRRDHAARGDRRRLPLLQREQRPAVRADLRPEGRVRPTRPTSCVGNDVRIGGQRVGAVDEITPVPRRGRRAADARRRA